LEGELINDQMMAEEALATLNLFLVKFPVFKSNEIYLTGRGFDGVLVANLAKLII
jgi:hypothetical protein